MKKSYSLPLNLRPNYRVRSALTRKRKVIDLEGFTDEKGAYVIRYKTRKISRFTGSSNILKIGCTEDSFKRRFQYYNHQADMTVTGSDLYIALKERSQKTNVRLMYFLGHTSGEDEIFIDFYVATSAQSPKNIEYVLIKKYIQKHKELPPLNFGMK